MVTNYEINSNKGLYNYDVQMTLKGVSNGN